MSKVIVEHVGRPGNRGLDGSDGLGVATANYGKLSSPYVEIFKVNKVADGLVWARDSEAAFQDRYNEQEIISTAESAQVLKYTNDFNQLEWNDPSSKFTVDTTNEISPTGSANASQLTIGDMTGVNDTILGLDASVSAGQIYRVSLYIQVISGTINSIKTALSGTNYAGGGDFDISNIGASWVRISTSVLATASTFRLRFDTTGCVINLYQINATKGAKLYDDIFTGAVVPDTFATGSLIYRQNELGYLSEQASENLALYSEDLSEWEVSGATVSDNVNFDTFDRGSSKTLLTINETSASLLISGLSLTEGAEYSVSLFPVLVFGSVASIGLSLGGGNAETISAVSIYDRVSVSCVAGSGDSISITLTTEQAGSQIAIAGVQVEQGVSTTYIPTASAPTSRAADKVTYDEYGLPSLIQPYTMQVGWNGVPINSLDKYLFNSDNLFSVRIVDSNIILQSQGADVLTYELENPESSEVFFVTDGITMFLYVDKLLKTTALYSGELGQPLTFNVGSGDGIGGSALNGYIERLTFWDFALTGDDIKYISEDI